MTRSQIRILFALALGALLLFLGGLVLRTMASYDATTSSAPSGPPTNAEDQASTNLENGWSYSEDKDAMRGTSSKFAVIESENEVSQSPPYDSTRATLTIRKRAKDGLNVMLRIDGQFVCDEVDDGHISVKFDGAKVERYGCSEPSDGSPGVIFIDDEAQFVRHMRKAKKMIIEANIYEHGAGQFSFNVVGLRWQ